jgi:hypothetical protein
MRGYAHKAAAVRVAFTPLLRKRSSIFFSFLLSSLWKMSQRNRAERMCCRALSLPRFFCVRLFGEGAG